MNHTSYFMTKLTDEAVWEHLQVLLREYDPEMEQKHIVFLSALEELAEAGADAAAFHRAIIAATVSDALFAFQKGMEANLYHFQHPYVTGFTDLDYNDTFQEYVMMLQPKRAAAEIAIEKIRAEYFQEDMPWCETINEYISDLEILVPKIMHFEGYIAGNVWFALAIPGYCEDSALTRIYSMQIYQYLGTPG